MIGNFGSLKGQRGFSFAELIIALVLFVSSVLGVSVMITSGHANVIRGAKELAASDLASKKIEEIKSLPFYVPYDPDPLKGPRDIDDFYWAYNGGVRYDNNLQFTHPHQENYGSIAGFGSYKRETAVKYQYVAGTESLSDAVMQTSPAWDPKATGGVNDVPTGGPAGGSYNNQLHFLLIQVKVYYMQDGVEKSYTSQGIAGDQLITGGQNAPPMVINSINPPEEFIQVNPCPMTIYVTAPGLNTSSTCDVTLWYPGTTDVHATSLVHPDSATTITCSFDLRASNGIRSGKYNLAVYWREEGWKAVYRDDTFKVKALPYQFTGISSNNWGHRGESSRTVTLMGQNLWGVTASMKGPTLGPNPNGYNIPQASIPVVSPDGTTATVTFNLIGTALERPPESYFNFELTGGGTPTPISTDGDDDNNRRFYMNPQPQITRVTPESGVTTEPAWGYRAQSARHVRIEGNYLYGMGGSDTGTSYLKCVENGIYQTANSINAQFVSGPTEANGCPSNMALVMSYDLSSSSAGSGVFHTLDSSHWQTFLTNYGGPANSSTGSTGTVLMNPPPNFKNPGGCTNFTNLKTGTASGQTDNIYTNLRVDGGYFQSNATVAFVKSAAVSPPANTPYQGLTGGTVNGDGTRTTDGGAGMYLSGMSMNVTVGNVAGMQFKQWPGSAPAADNMLTDTEAAGNGSYYILVTNGDLQAATYGPVLLNHNAFTATCTATPAGWGTVDITGLSGGLAWQDDQVIFTPVPAAASPTNYYCAFRVFQNGGTDEPSYASPYSFMISAPVAMNCRFAKWLYNGWDATNWNIAAWRVGKTESPCDAYDPNYNGDGGHEMRIKSHSNAGWDNGQSALATANKVNFTGATKMHVYVRQPENNVTLNNTTCVDVSGAYNDNYNTGQKWTSNTSFGWQWINGMDWNFAGGLACSTYGAGTNFIHINSWSQGGVAYGTACDIRVYAVFLE